MRIKVVFLGGSRALSGCAEAWVEVAQGAQVCDVARQVAAQYEALRPWIARVRFAVNHELARDDTEVPEGAEVGLLPPVQGGSPAAEITMTPLRVEDVVARVQHAGCGAAVVFAGTVRDHARGKSVVRLTYEAYEPMATRQLERIVRASEERYDGVRAALCHRVGTLEVGETSIVIAAASAHRDAAFEAVRWILERVKEEAAIWKLEHTRDGTYWVGMGGG